jgi:hypothetical protein
LSDNTKYFEIECRCGQKIEIEVEVAGSGFRSTEHGDEEFEYRMGFGELVIKGGMKE